MASLIEAAKAPDYPAEIALVISNRPDAEGLARAAAGGVATALVDHKTYPEREAFERALDEELLAHGVELLCFAGFMRILTPWFIERWRGRILNIHPSLLPKYRGLDTHARAIEAGDATAGCSVHVVTEELDAGEVLGQAKVTIEPGETPLTLEERVLSVEHELYPKVLSEFVCR